MKTKKVVKRIVQGAIVITLVFTIHWGVGQFNDLRNQLDNVKVVVKKQESKIDLQAKQIESLQYEVEGLKVKIQPKKEISQAKVIEEIETVETKLNNPLLSPAVVVGGVVTATGIIITIAKLLPLLAL